MRVEDLIKEGLLSKDIANVIFSTDELVQENRLDETSLIPTSYRVCSVYLSLMHAYVVGEAIYRGMTVDQLPYKHASSWVLKFWDTASTNAFNEKSVLSALILGAINDSDPKFFESSAQNLLCKVRDAYSAYSDPDAKRKVDLRQITVNDFKELLRSLPLLRTTFIDSEKFEFVFSFDTVNKFSIKCYPFIGYWDAENARTITADTPAREDDEPHSCYVLIGAHDGGNSSSIRTEIMVLDDVRDFETGRLKTKLVQYSSNNEYIRMICNAVKHPIEWVSIDDSVCNLAFLTTLATTVSESLIEFWNTYSSFSTIGTSSVAGSLKKMFKGSPMLYDAIDLNAYIEETELVNTFYGLFIQYGVFKTMFALFLDSDDESYGDKFFEIYVKHMENLTDDSRKVCKTECELNIEQHLCKLQGIVPESSPLAFSSRARAIRAECRAQCALQAAGLRADKLFAEQEDIRSIDNFYYMIKNSSTQLMDDLKNVLIMLISLYRTILTASIPLRKHKFHANMWDVKAKISDFSVLELLEEFKKTVLDSKNNEKLEHYLGRSCICDLNKLESYVRHLRMLIPKLQQQMGAADQSMPQIFISYAHKDLDIVRRYTEHFKKSNIPIYLDETKFHCGDVWISRAKDYIYSVHCKAVVVFLSKNSVESEPVSKEVGAAVEAAKDKFRDQTDRERFIIPINIEDEDTAVYLYNKLKRPNDVSRGGFSPDTFSFADEIAKGIVKEKIYKKISDWDIESLERDIKERLNARLDGTLVESQRPYNDLEYAVASFYAFLKFGDDFKGSTQDTIDRDFTTLPINGKSCIFPLVTSVKETNIKRDNITLMGYEIVGGKDAVTDKTTNYILSSRRLPPDDYYCLPNSKTTAKDCAWMVEPLLINDDLFIKPPAEDCK